MADPRDSQANRPEFSDPDNGDFRAALTWSLLQPAARREIAKHLTLEELERLNHAWKIFQKLPRADRLRIERQVHRATANKNSPWPMALSLAVGILSVGLMLIHTAQVPLMAWSNRSLLFAPLLLATIAPLTLYLLPRYRLSALFLPRFDPQSLIAAVLCYVGLIWILFFIGEEQTGGQGFVRLDTLSLLVYSVGAFFAPLLEEIVYREFLPSIDGRPPHYIGHFIGALLFAASHLPDTPELFVLNLSAALLLSGVRLFSGGLLWCYLAHAAANVTVLWIG